MLLFIVVDCKSFMEKVGSTLSSNLGPYLYLKNYKLRENTLLGYFTLTNSVRTEKMIKLKTQERK